MTSQNVIWALRHFRELILGYKIHVQTYHYAMKETFKDNNFIGQFARWQLTIQEINPTFSSIPVKANSVADALSRSVAAISAITENPAL